HPRHRQNITDRISTMSALVARRYLGDLWRFGGRRLLFVGAVTLAGAVTDGIGLLMLVPLLELVGAGRASGIGSTARGAFHAAGVPFTLGWVLVFYVVLIVIRALLAWQRTVATTKFQLEFVDWQRLRVLDAMTHADWLHHVLGRTSDVVHGVTADIFRVGQGTSLLLQAI